MAQFAIRLPVPRKSPNSGRARVAQTFRFRPEVVAILQHISSKAGITKTRALEECVLRQSKDVANNPFPMLASTGGRR